jgi:hypothetical protein
MGHPSFLYLGTRQKWLSLCQVLHPDFQRFFRWDEEQKSRLIESVLLGIPLPSVFVFQRKDGVWDVIDGVQRLSTIFQFLGILEDSSEKLVTPLRLQSTRYLPSLKDKAWERPDLDQSTDSQTKGSAPSKTCVAYR